MSLRSQSILQIQNSIQFPNKKRLVTSKAGGLTKVGSAEIPNKRLKVS